MNYLYVCQTVSSSLLLLVFQQLLAQASFHYSVFSNLFLIPEACPQLQTPTKFLKILNKLLQDSCDWYF